MHTICRIAFMLYLSLALTELGAFKRTEFLCISILRVASGPRVKLADRKSALTPPSPPPPPPPPHPLPHRKMVYSTDRSKAVANLSAFRMFVRFALIWFCLFPLPLGIWDGLRLVIVALPGLFSYLIFFFFFIKNDTFPELFRKICITCNP